jgi:tetratricopeptide (TPR) repeat protein
VWKAKVLLDMGRHEEAEAVARQAIAIDPSDGEQGKGDRMRVYAVLSDILAKRGDAAQSQVYANAVRAIRLSEDADDFYAAGMSSRAIAMYQEALTIFEDAYCIQSRLALQLLEAGRSDEAAVHFRKAFELMPDSFGRIESHCFGCEHLFESAQAQDIALSVLQQLLKDRPDKPQVSYLLGYLLSSRQKHVEAATHLERAVELDPQYINAWILLLSTYESTGAPAAKRDKAALAIASLDPLGKHSTAASVSGLTDFAQLWNLGNQAFLNAEKGAGGLFELTATKRLFESLPEGMSVYSMGSTDVSSGPAVYLLASPLISGIMNLISGGYSLWGETMSIGG